MLFGCGPGTNFFRVPFFSKPSFNFLLFSSIKSPKQQKYNYW